MTKYSRLSHKFGWTLFLFVLIGFALYAPAMAWNRAGHMVTGAIAYKELKASNPAALNQIITLLRQHPDYPKWQAQINEQQLAGENGEMYLFELAARWADDIRETPFDHPTWHYINYPLIAPGYTVDLPMPAPENIIKAFASNLDILNSDTAAPERAVALCWIFHLVGDVHQPLHTTALFSSDYPKGDRGGNLIYIRVDHEAATITLHAFWDDLILGSDRFQPVTNKATELRATINRQSLTELTVKSFDRWALESFNLAVTVAYRNGEIKGGPSKDEGIGLPRNYLDLSKPVAERRLVLAGYRLADTLLRVANALNSGQPGSGLSNPPPETTPAPVSTADAVIGNKKSKVYHLPTCPDYKKVSEKNRILFKTEIEAEQTGYRRARNCR